MIRGGQIVGDVETQGGGDEALVASRYAQLVE